jgi:hypothetical protein
MTQRSHARKGERRRTRRRAPGYSRLKSAALPVDLLNLSDGGLAVESREALRIGACYPFTLTGDPVEGGLFRGRVLWCRLARTEKGDDGDVHAVYRAGIRRVRDEEERE